MNFSDALVKLKEGRKMRRASWNESEFIEVRYDGGKDCFFDENQRDFDFSNQAILADDWEIVEAEQSPEAENVEQSPEAENVEQSPEAENAEQSPEAESAEQSPEAESVEQSPEAVLVEKFVIRDFFKGFYLVDGLRTALAPLNEYEFYSAKQFDHYTDAHNFIMENLNNFPKGYYKIDKILMILS